MRRIVASRAAGRAAQWPCRAARHNFAGAGAGKRHCGRMLVLISTSAAISRVRIRSHATRDHAAHRQRQQMVGRRQPQLRKGFAAMLRPSPPPAPGFAPGAGCRCPAGPGLPRRPAAIAGAAIRETRPNGATRAPVRATAPRCSSHLRIPMAEGGLVVARAFGAGRQPVLPGAADAAQEVQPYQVAAQYALQAVLRQRVENAQARE